MLHNVIASDGLPCSLLVFLVVVALSRAQEEGEVPRDHCGYGLDATGNGRAWARCLGRPESERVFFFEAVPHGGPLLGLAGRTVAECEELTQSLDFEHVQGGSLAQLTTRVCNKFDWLAVEFRAKPELYRTWVRNEQFGVALDDILAIGTLRQCFRRFLSKRASQEVLDFFQDVQNYRGLPASSRALDACRIFDLYAAANTPSPVELPRATVRPPPVEFVFFFVSV